VLDIVRRLRQAGHASFLVGGCVRDVLRGAAVKDYDVATSAKPTEVMKIFRRVAPTGIAHGTVTVLSQRGHPVEVTTFRGEGEYLDGRRPSEVRFLDDIREDLSRRDFTINAMAFDPTTPEFVDPFGGRRDLSRRLIRCVGEPEERFGEDGLRPLRAVRFASTLGFSIDPATKRAIPRSLETFRRVAAERVRDELSRMLLGPAPSRGIRLLADTGLLTEFLPELGPGAALAHVGATLDGAPAKLEVRLAALLHFAGRSACGPVGGPGSAAVVSAVLERLRYPRKTIEIGALLVGELPLAESVAEDDRALRRFLARVRPENLEDVLALLSAHAGANGKSDPKAVDRAERVAHRLVQIRDSKPALSTAELALGGKEVIALLGEKPGPRVGEALRFLLDRVLDDPTLNRPESLRELLQSWAKRDQT
jgi:tRNA nucleotidyltransferase (CCA-adding enzyme)